MQVILLERVENLGQMGDLVNVKPGFARNYLLPMRKALRATKENQARFEAERAQLEAQNLERRKEAEQVAERMDGVGVVIVRAASESGQLYGSVTARDIAEAATDAGYRIGRGQVIIDRPVKSLGIFDIRIRLHPEVAVTLKLNVAQSQEEAQAQEERVARGEPAVMTAALQDQQEAQRIAEEHMAAMAAVRAEAEGEEAETVEEAVAGQDVPDQADDVETR